MANHHRPPVTEVRLIGRTMQETVAQSRIVALFGHWRPLTHRPGFCYGQVRTSLHPLGRVHKLVSSL